MSSIKKKKTVFDYVKIEGLDKILDATPSQKPDVFRKDGPCWVEVNDVDAEPFHRATMLREEAGFIEVVGDDGNQNSYPKDKVLQASDENSDIDDLVNLPILNNAELLNSLRIRFEKDKIFSYVGSALITLNPFKPVLHLFTKDILTKFHEMAEQKHITLSNQPPHVWGIAANAYKQCFENNKDQSILISGESGAGKTENTKFALGLFTSLSHREQEKKGSERMIGDVAQQIMQCNPILEAFGNAKTVRNNNSSRFGKFIQLLIDRKSRTIKGAQMEKYLLEKSRVTSPSTKERSFHVFYHFLKGFDEGDRERYHLTRDPSEYSYLRQSGVYKVDTIEDEKQWVQMLEAMEGLQIPMTEQIAIQRILAAILHLGNLSFDTKFFDETTNVPCDFHEDSKSRAMFISELLDIQFEDLVKGIMFKKFVEKGSSKPLLTALSYGKCVMNCDTLARELYDKLFDWLFHRLNFAILPEEERDSYLKGEELQEIVGIKKIGVLDIFGFEVFDSFNGFEQMCINFTNEKLHNLYIDYVFKAEEAEFSNEGLSKEKPKLSYVTNDELIDIFEGKTKGIFILLDNVCKINQGDEAFFNNVVKTLKDGKLLEEIKFSKDKILIHHSARDVTYTVAGFTARNRDEVGMGLVDMVNSTYSKEIARIYQGLLEGQRVKVPEEEKSGGGGKFLGEKFRNAVRSLMTQLKTTEAHFIRCVKTTHLLTSGVFDSQLIYQQINYMGVLDAIKIRKDSYPIRRFFSNFYSRYGDFDPLAVQKPVEQLEAEGFDFRSSCQRIIEFLFNSMRNDKVLFGKTKVFMRQDISNLLDTVLSKWVILKENAVRKLKKAYRRLYLRNMIKKVRQLIITFQGILKMRKDRDHFDRARTFAIKGQDKLRLFRFRRYMDRLRGAQTTISKRWKGFKKQRGFAVMKKWFKLGIIMWSAAKMLRILRRQRWVAKVLQEVIDTAYPWIEVYNQRVAQVTISKRWRGFTAKRSFELRKKWITAATFLKYYAKLLAKLQKIRAIRQIVDEVVEAGFPLIEIFKQRAALLTISRNWRGHVTRKSYSLQMKWIKAIRIMKYTAKVLNKLKLARLMLSLREQIVEIGFPSIIQGQRQLAAAYIQQRWRKEYSRKNYQKTNQILREAIRLMKKRRLVSYLRKAIFISKCVKVVVAKGWTMMRTAEEGKAAVVIQRYARGTLARMKHGELAQRAKFAGAKVRLEKSAALLQKNTKGYLARRTLKKKKDAVRKIQGFMRMLWMSRSFQTVRRAVRKIQKYYGRYILRKRALQAKTTEILVPEMESVLAAKKEEASVIYEVPENSIL